MASFLNGAAAMACIAVGTFFARFWRETGDRLFWCLAAAFWLFAVNYAAIGVLPLEDERGERTRSSCAWSGLSRFWSACC